MIDKQFIQQLVDDFLKENSSFFLVSLKINSGNQIEVLIDSFNGVGIKDCMALSRKIEGSLDREENDFSLQVSSAGLSEPFKVFNQYQKYVGSNIKVQLKDGNHFSAKLIDARKDDGITIEIKKKERVGKKKKEVLEQLNCSFENIDKTKLIIKI